MPSCDATVHEPSISWNWRGQAVKQLGERLLERSARMSGKRTILVTGTLDSREAAFAAGIPPRRSLP
jgi:hypothetical protein